MRIHYPLSFYALGFVLAYRLGLKPIQTHLAQKLMLRVELSKSAGVVSLSGRPPSKWRALVDFCFFYAFQLSFCDTYFRLHPFGNPALLSLRREVVGSAQDLVCGFHRPALVVRVVALHADVLHHACINIPNISTVKKEKGTVIQAGPCAHCSRVLT
jgi:hypothetical protein